MPPGNHGRNTPAIGKNTIKGPRQTFWFSAGLSVYYSRGTEYSVPLFQGVPGLRSSQGRGAALDRQRGRRSRAGASLLRPQRRGTLSPQIQPIYRGLPVKNSATVPGPLWAPITGPMVPMQIRFTPKALILSATYWQSSRQSPWLMNTVWSA